MAVGDLELFVKTLDLPNGYTRLTSEPVEIVEGILQVATATGERIASLATKPGDSDSGLEFESGSNLAWDPTSIGGLPNRRLDAMWWKEANADAGAVIKFQGTVRRVG